MSNTDDEVCGNCRFWLANVDNDYKGECRMLPPVVVVVDHVVATRWPTTGEGDFCGKFEVRR